MALMQHNLSAIETVNFNSVAENAAFVKVTKSILETILQLPWLDTNAGGVFLADQSNQELRLVAEINFSTAIKKSCARVDFGYCLCGRVAESAQSLHVECVDERHDTYYEGMCDHGHYVVPIKIQSQLIGVMVLYIRTGHKYNIDEIQVLENFADIIALLIHNTQTQLDKQIADLVLSRSNHGVTITDPEMKIEWINPAFEKLSGYTLEEVAGKTPAILKSGRHGKDFYAAMWYSIKEKGYWEGEIWNRRKNGEVYPEWLNIVALKGSNGEVLRYAAMFVDLSTIKSAEDKIHRLAYYDNVTDLANSELLHKRLKKMLYRSRKEGGQVVIVALALDNFRNINAVLGRRAGDAMLCETAQRITGLKEGAIEARTGSDEFIIACLEPQVNDISLINLVAQLKKKLRVSFKYEQHELCLDNSVGIAWSNGRDTDVDSLLRRSTIALAYCKEHSRGGHRFHNQEIEKEVDYRHFLGMNIGKAIERKELFLVYQPQVNRKGRVIGAEVLLRWHNKELGNIPPDVFISIAEERGSIIDIGRWVFEETLKQLLQWQQNGLCESGYFERLAVNVSPHQILSRNIINEFSRACTRYGFPPSLIELEITESGISEDSKDIVKHLHSLSEMGFKIAIDDFGTGHSSLSRLRHFPISIVKIDQSFVRNMGDDSSSTILVKSIIDMAHTLGFQVIAEGVENAQQLKVLLDFGCDIFQGYYFSKPVSADEFIVFTKKRSACAALE